MDIAQILLNTPLVQPSQTPRAAPPEAAADDEAGTAQQLRTVAQQFETVFLHQIVKQMKETVDHTSLDEEDESGEQIQSMYWSFMADAMGQQGGLGFWKTIYEDLAAAKGLDLERFPARDPRFDERA